MTTLFRFLLLCFTTLTLFANTSTQFIKSDYTVILSKNSDEGQFFNRFRMNAFSYQWERETNKQKNSVAMGIGGSMLYQSPKYNGFDMRVGLYYSYALTSLSSLDASLMKSSGDILSRLDYLNYNKKDLAVIGQAYLRYSRESTELKIGRFLVESFYAKSNDSKMIPNSFEGVLLHSTLSDTHIQLAYLNKYKQRGSSFYSSSFLLSQNISSDNPLILIDVFNQSISNLKVYSSFYLVPQILSSAMMEFRYQYHFDDFSICTGLRYLKQFSYNPSQMLASRVMLKYDNIVLSFGYSKVFDEGDLITPWRGFATTGYTRSMARYNTLANTQSYRLKLQVNPNILGIYHNLYIEASILHTNSDELKGFYDENYYYLGFIKNLSDDIQVRLRLGYEDTLKPSADALDTRIELNYIF